MGDLESALAFVARREGTIRMPLARWALVLSLDLGWMSPTQAKEFVGRAHAAGILQGEEVAELRLDVNQVPVPPRFRPDPTARAESHPAPMAANAVDHSFLAWVDRYAKAANCDRGQALQRVAALQDRLGGMLTADVAVLWLAREAGLDVGSAARSFITTSG